MLGQPGRTRDCQLEARIEEGSGHLTLNITRRGNLEQEMGVVCYTEDDTAIGNADYVSRLEMSAGSVVMFGVNQSLAECVVEIVDDKVFESRERFHVHLAATSKHGFFNIDEAFSSICIYINFDERDGKYSIYS